MDIQSPVSGAIKETSISFSQACEAVNQFARIASLPHKSKQRHKTKRLRKAKKSWIESEIEGEKRGY